MKLEGFIGPTYALAHPSAGAQRLVNLYPEIHEAGPRKGNVARFVGTPGLRLRATLGTGAIRGTLYTSTGQLFVVSNASVYEVASDWTPTLRPGSLGTYIGRVTMAELPDDASGRALRAAAFFETCGTTAGVAGQGRILYRALAPYPFGNTAFRGPGRRARRIINDHAYADRRTPPGRDPGGRRQREPDRGI